jgi:ferredoxin
MTYVVTENCIKCKYLDCVEVCPGLEKWLELNTEYSAKWPNITENRGAPPDAKEFDGMPNKFEKFFSSEPGTGS